MTLQDIIKKHPNRYVVLRALERDSDGKVVSWEVLNTSSSLEEAKELQQNYKMQFVSGVVIYDTSEPEDEFQASIAAQFFRVYYNLED